jgi:hypothetical protein
MQTGHLGHLMAQFAENSHSLWSEIPNAGQTADPLLRAPAPERRRRALTLDDPAQRRSKRLESVGLLEDRGQSLAFEALRDVLAIATDDRNLHGRSDLPEPTKGLLAVHVGHCEIEEHAHDAVAVLPVQLKRSLAIARDQRSEAQQLEHSFTDSAHLRFVVDEQDGTAPAPVHDRGARLGVNRR